MLSILNNLKVRVKFLIVIILFLLPLAFSSYLYIRSIDKEINFSSKENGGKKFIVPLVKALYELNSLNIANLQGDKSQVNEHKAKILSALGEWQKMDDLAKDLLFVDEELARTNNLGLKPQNLLNKWYNISNKDVMNNDDLASFANDLVAAIAFAGNKSNLILDPDLDSYYVMDAYIVNLPAALLRSFNLSSDIDKIYQSNNFTSANLAKFVEHRGMIIQNDQVSLNGDIQTAFQEDQNFYGISPTLKNLQPVFDEYNKRSNIVASLLQKAFDNPHSIAISLWLDALSDLNKATYDLAENSGEELEKLIQMRIDNFISERNKGLTKFIIILLLPFFSAVLVSTNIVSTIKALHNAIQKISANVLNIEIPCLEFKDEFGDMAKALSIFRSQALENQTMHEERAKQSEIIQKEKKEAARAFAENFGKVVQDIIHTISAASTELNATAEDMLKNASNSAEQATKLQSMSKESSSNVSTVASATEEISSIVQSVKDQVNHSADTAMKAKEDVLNASKAASRLKVASNEVNEVVAKINDIAEQINLLALNATIEAARAGEAGKGFAVVASEVKNLAVQASNATNEIESIISSMRNETDSTVHSVQNIESTINQVNDTSLIVVSSFSEQEKAINEIAINAQNAAVGVEKINLISDKVSGSAQSTNNSSVQIVEASKELSKQAEELQMAVSDLLNKIRSENEL